MVRNDAIGNDQDKEKLCISRAHAQNPSGKVEPFEIDASYVASKRSLNPDATFVAIGGALIECFLAWGNGKFVPASSTGENSHWHLIRPEGFEPGIHTKVGMRMAAKVCVDAAPAKINRPNFDHSVYSTVVEINIGGGRLYQPGVSIAGLTAERYDIAVKGMSFYKSSGPDLDVVNFTCLLSPKLDLKAIQAK